MCSRFNWVMCLSHKTLGAFVAVILNGLFIDIEYLSFSCIIEFSTPTFQLCIVLFDPFYCGNYCHVNIKIILLPSEVMLRPWAEAVLLLLMPPVSGVSLSTLAELLSNICWPEALEWEERWTDDWALNTSVLSRPRPSLYFTSHQSWTQERLRQWWFVFVLCPKL